MKNSTVQKGYQSAQTSHHKVNQNHPVFFQTSIGLAMDKYEKAEKDFEDEKALKILKDDSRLNTTGTDDDLAIDIQDAIGRNSSLSLVADNILVTVEGEIVTLAGEVYREAEKLAAGDIAGTFAGEDNVNNILNVINSGN